MKANKIPMDASKIIDLWRYSFGELKSYDELTDKEKAILTEEDFCIIKGLI